MADSFIKTAVILDKMAGAETSESLRGFLVSSSLGPLEAGRRRKGMGQVGVAGTLEKTRKVEARVTTDEDLKQSDALRYYMRETQAAKVPLHSPRPYAGLPRHTWTGPWQNLLYRRTRCLANYEGANRALERARAKNKDVQVRVLCWGRESVAGKAARVQRAETEQTAACERYEAITEVARAELKDLKKRSAASPSPVTFPGQSGKGDSLGTRRVEAFAKALVELGELELKQAKAHAGLLQTAVANLRQL